jgi:hypothetical protein
VHCLVYFYLDACLSGILAHIILIDCFSIGRFQKSILKKDINRYFEIRAETHTEQFICV